MLEKGHIVGKYEVQSVLGEGGMAQVYKVTHQTLGSFHALKVLTLRNRQVIERMLQEGRLQAGLRHPNVVPVTDVLDIDGAPGLIMDFVDGPSLFEWLHDHNPTLAEAEELFRGIVAGVAEAHAQGLVHRDLKPANVLMQQTATGMLPRVADFGLAKVVESTAEGPQTRAGTTMGTPAYMAPEQVKDAKTVDQRADVFSLGCILYDLVCGKQAFDDHDLLSLLTKTREGDYVPPNKVVPGLPARVQRAIVGALEPDRDKRFATCVDLLAALADDSVPAPEPKGNQPGASTLSSLTSLAQDNPKPVGAMAGAVLLTGLAAVAGLGMALCFGVGIGVSSVGKEEPPPPDEPAFSIGPFSVGKSPKSETPQPASDEPVPHSSPCTAWRSRLLGYAQVRGFFVYRQGDEWYVMQSKNVHASMPTADNDYTTDDDIVCVLESGDRVMLQDAPIKVRGSGWWVPVYSKSVDW